jgi:hypothetical protein
MITEDFDRRMIAVMKVALERACGHWPNGGTHKLRKRVAQGIIRCAKAGNTSLDALSEAGESALAQSRTARMALRSNAIGGARTGSVPALGKISSRFLVE